MKFIFYIVAFLILTAASCQKIVYVDREVVRDTTIVINNKSFEVRDSLTILKQYDTLWIQPYIAEKTVYINRNDGTKDSLKLWVDVWKKEFIAKFDTKIDSNKTIREKRSTVKTDVKIERRPFWEMPALIFIGVILGLVIGFFAVKYLERLK